MFSRVWLAWAVFFRILFDGKLALQVRALSAGEAPAAAPAPVLPAEPAPPVAAPPAAANPVAPPEQSALLLLQLLQEKGRFIDFVKEDLTRASDQDIGAAARVVHEGCAKVLQERASIEPLRSEDEGASIEVPAGYAAAEVKLTGELRGSAPFRGVLRHRGWVVQSLRLPEPTAGHRAEVLAAAEVEL